jgi:hypothetical protein
LRQGFGLARDRAAAEIIAAIDAEFDAVNT